MYLLTVAVVLAATATAVVLVACWPLVAPRRCAVAASAPPQPDPKRRDDFTLAS